MTGRLVHLTLAIILLATLVLGCVPETVTPAPAASSSSSEETPEPVTVIYADRDWGYPSPFGFYPRGPGYVRMSLLFDTLTWKDDTGIVPLLAKDWQVSDDGLQWSLSLRDGVTFHDGEPLTVADVVFSYTYLQAHATEFAWDASLDKLAGVEARDDATLVITLTEPLAGFLVDMAGTVPIIPKHIWESVDDPVRFTDPEAVIGSGPFRLVEYNKEEARYIYEANPDYFLGKPVVDRLVFRKVQDDALALQTGDVDAATFSGKECTAVEVLEQAGKKATEGPSYWVLQVIMNTTQAPLDSIAVRQAIAKAINREQIVEQVTQQGAVVANLGIISPDTEWANPDLPAYPYAPQEAKAALEELGIGDLELSLITTSNYVREAELIRASLAEAGISVEIKTGDTSTVDGLLREGTFDLAVTGHGGIANPSILATPDWPAGTYSNPSYNALFAAQAAETDTEARRALVYRLQEIIAEELPVITLYHPTMWLVYDPGSFDGWYFTEGGIGKGIPLATNKLVFLPE